MNSKTTTKTSTHSKETRESFLYLYEAGVRPAVAVYERRTNYSFLGAALQPSAAANFATVVAQVRGRAPHARYDGRLTHPFALGVTPLAPTGMDAGEWKSDIAAALLSLTA